MNTTCLHTIRPMPCMLYGMDLGHMKIKAPFLYRLQKYKKKKEDHIINVTEYYPGELALIFTFANFYSVQIKSLSIQSFHCTFFIS